MADNSVLPQPVLATGWQRCCGQIIMLLCIILTVLFGLCPMRMTIADLSDSSGHSGNVLSVR